MLTWGELDRRARALGSWFDRTNARGERAVLLYPSGLDYITALYGCLYAGVIAVPAYPPRMNRHLSRILAIVEDCAPKYVLTDSTLIGGIRGSLSNYPALEKIHWIATDMLDLSAGADWTPNPSAASAPALLQYTSGSTASPKGVVISPDNLVRNQNLISSAFQVDERSVIVSWLPMYHDMGLIGNILATGWLGAECYVMSPAAFVRRPAAWLHAVSRFRATASGGPNFAYDLCVQKIAEADCAGLDLSRWRTAFNGAEPVRAATMERFAAKFHRYGFRSDAFLPCYGMAEATLFVAGTSPERGPVIQSFDKQALAANRAVVRPPDTGEPYVSSGRACADRVIIVDPSTRLECAPGVVGEIWVSDASVAAGYWGRSGVSAEIFGARLAPTEEGPFLRTGDLGVMNEGELFVLGRLKDLIIIRGRNLYPHDIEATAEAAHPALCPRGVIAFGVEVDGEERLIIVAEVVREQRSRFKPEDVGESVYRAIASQHGVSLFELVFVQPASMLKTSSGKLQRTATRQAYLERTLDELTVWRNVIHDEGLVTNEYRGTFPGIADLQGWLASVVSMKLNIPASRLDPHRPIADYGLDSLAGVELIATIEEKLGMDLPFDSLFVGEPSLARLTAMLFDKLSHRSILTGADEITIALPASTPLDLRLEQEANR
jgi:acyl-CoA synthetase (AMP-forming)/AMP-acid ligase II/acyl carrier protein